MNTGSLIEPDYTRAMPELHPTILTTDGAPAFVVLPWTEYEALRAAAADSAWDAAIAATTPEDVARIDAEIAADTHHHMPMFNEHGKVILPVFA